MGQINSDSNTICLTPSGTLLVWFISFASPLPSPFTMLRRPLQFLLNCFLPQCIVVAMRCIFLMAQLFLFLGPRLNLCRVGQLSVVDDHLLQLSSDRAGRNRQGARIEDCGLRKDGLIHRAARQSTVNGVDRRAHKRAQWTPQKNF